MQAQSLEELKSEVQLEVGKEGTSDSSSYSDGVNEAMDDIVKVMNTLTRPLSAMGSSECGRVSIIISATP